LLPGNAWHDGFSNGFNATVSITDDEFSANNISEGLTVYSRLVLELLVRNIRRPFSKSKSDQANPTICCVVFKG
jgi:hypothetical protein